MTRLFLLRHGETEWSSSGRHTSRTELPLTLHGELEATALGHRLRQVVFDNVFSSPRKRATATCTLAGLGDAVELDATLAEWNYGHFEGLRSPEILKKHPGWNLFRDGCPSGESPAQASARADDVIARLRALNGTIALFSHGQFSCVLAVRWVGLPVAEARHFQLATGSLSVLDYDPHHREMPVISLWNESPDGSVR